MIETAMIFAAGMLVATLLALLVIPAINRRAERLARRRVEALFPLSITELTAEKDALRAEFAVTQRRLERKAEEALAAKHGFMEEHGRRAVRIQALEAEVAARQETIAGLERLLEDTRGALARTQDELADTKIALSGARDTLSALGDAHTRTLEELATTRGELSTTAVTLNEARGQLATTRERLDRRESEYSDLATRYAAALGENDTRRITISDLETRLAMQTTRGNEFERAAAERSEDLAAERQRLADLARNLLAEQERGLSLDQRIRALEAERDARAAEVAALQARLDEVPAPLAPAGDGTDVRAENAELRRRLDELADRLMAIDAPSALDGETAGRVEEAAPEGSSPRRQRGSRRPATA